MIPAVAVPHKFLSNDRLVIICGMGGGPLLRTAVMRARVGPDAIFTTGLRKVYATALCATVWENAFAVPDGVTRSPLWCG